MKSSQESKERRIVVAGFGGQGIMFLGKVLAQAATIEGKNVTYIRSYGAEMRGGTAHCLIKISSKPIASPIFKEADIAVVMNQLSFDKFKDKITDNGIIIGNSSLIKPNAKSHNQMFLTEFNKLAYSLGNIKSANMIALGYLLQKSPVVDKKSVIKVIKDKFKGNKQMLNLNLQALEALQ